MSKQENELDALLILRRRYLPAATWQDEQIEAAAHPGSPKAPLMAFLGSKEFRKAFPGLFSGMCYDYKLPRIDLEVDPDTLRALFTSVAEEWTQLG